MKQTMQLTASSLNRRSSPDCSDTTDGEWGHCVTFWEQAALRQQQYRKLVSTSCLPRKPRMSHRCMVVLHQDHQRCHGPQSQKSWSGTGTEDVKRELQELALHKTV